MGLGGAIRAFGMVKVRDGHSDGGGDPVVPTDVVGVAFEQDAAYRVQARYRRRSLLLCRRN